MSRIYLVDDHALVRDALTALLTSDGHDIVGSAGDRVRALAGIVETNPDLILLDLKLEAESGLDLLDDLRIRGMAQRVIVVSMSENPADIAQTLEAGVRGYVVKGTAGSVLLEAIAEVAAGRTHIETRLQALASRWQSQRTDSQLDPGALLSARERQILLMVARGASSASIGMRLHLSPKTIDTYRSRLMRKLGLGNVPDLVRWAVRAGWLDIDER